MIFAAPLSHRTVIRIGGPDRHAFLQGLLSNDVTKAKADTAIYAALLTPQGKFLYDLFLIDSGDAFLVDCESASADDLLRKLTSYKLRSKVAFENLSAAFDIWAIWGENYTAPLAFADPRLPELGIRLFIEKNQTPANATLTDFAAYDEQRLICGIADGSRDMEIEKSTLAEGNFDFLNGIDWKKGCYVGQELTARMHYRGLAKKRLFPVKIEGEAPPFGTEIDEAGEMRSARVMHGLALLKIDAVHQMLDRQQPLIWQNTKIWPSIPDWLKI